MAKTPRMVICSGCNATISERTKKCPNCGTKNKQSPVKGFFKGLLIFILIIIVALAIILFATDRDEQKKKDNATFDWDEIELAQMLPEPSTSNGDISHSNDSSFSLYVYNVSEDEFDDYVKECKDIGFTADFSEFSTSYYADNAEGYSLSISYDEDDKEMRISLSSPIDTSNSEETHDESTANEKTSEPKNEETSAPKNDETTISQNTEDIRSEFKEAMDSYELFFEEYCEFMKKIEENPDDLTLLADYASYLSKYADMMEKFEAWENEEMNDAEAKYYMEVQLRINEMLYEVAQ